MRLSEIIHRTVQQGGMGFKHATNLRVIAGDYALSIQASDTHYCEPRETFEDMDKYTRVEMAIFNLSDDEWTNCAKSEIINDFPRVEELKERAEEWDSKGRSSVFGYVPVDLIIDFIEYLSSEDSIEELI